MPRDHGSTIKDDKRYEALRRQGISKGKAARIANARQPEASRRGGKAENYEQWSRDELYQKARKIGIDGRSRMSKRDLIEALRR